MAVHRISLNTMKKTLFALCSGLLWSVIGSAEEYTPDTELVRLGNASVHIADVDAMASQLPENIRGGHFNHPERIGALLKTMVVRRAMAAEVLQQHRRYGLDIDAIRSEATRKVLARLQLEALTAQEMPDLEQAARDHYQQNLDSYRIPESVSVSHILVKTDLRPAQEALELSQDIYGQLTAGESTFADAVERFSEDPAAANNGGRYDRVVPGQMVPAFEKAAFELQQPGELTEPVKSRYGYHIITLHERHPATLRPFESVRAVITGRLQGKLREQTKSGILARYENPVEALHNLAIENGLSSQPLFSQQVELTFEESLVSAYREAYLEQNITTDFSGLARERYLTNRDEYRAPDEIWIDYVRVAMSEDREASRALAEGFRDIAARPLGMQTLVTNPAAEVHRLRLIEGEEQARVSVASYRLTTTGELTALIESSQAFHFAQLVDRKRGAVRPFEQVREEIVTKLNDQTRGKLWQNHINRFEQLPMKANPEAIASLRTRYVIAGDGQLPATENINAARDS